MSFLHGVQVVVAPAPPPPIVTSSQSVIGIVDIDDECTAPANTPVLVRSMADVVALYASEQAAQGETFYETCRQVYAQARCEVVIVRVPDPVDAEEGEAAALLRAAAIVGSSSAGTGMYALLKAKAAVDRRPKLIVSSMSGFRPEDSEPGDYLPNPVAVGALPVLTRLRAHMVVDGPGWFESAFGVGDDGGDAAAIQSADDLANRRFYVHECYGDRVLLGGNIVAVPSSARVAGQIAANDGLRGWWTSPSNTQAAGILGTSEPIEFSINDTLAQASVLNQGNVATTVREQGFRLWGNRTCSTDVRFAFLHVSRIIDTISDSIEESSIDLVDKNVTARFVDEVVERTNAYIRELVTLGALLGGYCQPNEALNTPESVTAGQLYFDIVVNPTPVAEGITFTVALTDEFVGEVFNAG